MTPLGWLRLGARNVPTPAPATLTADDILARIRDITHPQPAVLDPVRATVLRLTREDQAEPGDPFPPLLPGLPVRPALRRYSEADDEIGGSKRYDDGLGD